MSNFDMEEFTVSAKPVKFYEYPHVVTNRIVKLNDDFTFGFYRNTLVDHFNMVGIKAVADNKTVFEVEFKGVHFFIGFYDWKMYIGLSCRRVR